jgi:hypothetical protein
LVLVALKVDNSVVAVQDDIIPSKGVIDFTLCGTALLHSLYASKPMLDSSNPQPLPTPPGYLPLATV